MYGEDELPPHPCPTDDNGRSLNDPEAQQHDDGIHSNENHTKTSIIAYTTQVRQAA